MTEKDLIRQIASNYTKETLVLNKTGEGDEKINQAAAAESSKVMQDHV